MSTPPRQTSSHHHRPSISSSVSPPPPLPSRQSSHPSHQLTRQPHTSQDDANDTSPGAASRREQVYAAKIRFRTRKAEHLSNLQGAHGFLQNEVAKARQDLSSSKDLVEEIWQVLSEELGNHGYGDITFEALDDDVRAELLERVAEYRRKKGLDLIIWSDEELANDRRRTVPGYISNESAVAGPSWVPGSSAPQSPGGWSVAWSAMSSSPRRQQSLGGGEMSSAELQSPDTTNDLRVSWGDPDAGNHRRPREG